MECTQCTQCTQSVVVSVVVDDTAEIRPSVDVVVVAVAVRAVAVSE